MSIKKIYNILVSEYAKKHFIKLFEKKYKDAWIKTFEFINIVLSDIELYLKSTKVNKIHICDTGYIAKCEFKVVGSNESAKSSGNRIIVYVNEVNLEAHILLLYSKTDIKGDNETSWRQNEIKQNHKDISKLFSNIK